MSVGTFTQPDHTTQDGSTYKTAINNAIMALAPVGQAFAPREKAIPVMTVRLDAGRIFDGDTLRTNAPQTSPLIVAPVSQDRIDRVVIDAITGIVEVVTGTEAASPIAPAIPSGKLPVARVYLTPATTSITNDLITDERALLTGAGASSPVCPWRVGDILQTVREVLPGVPEDPEEQWPGTTWALWGSGRMPVGFDGAQTEFDAVGETGGAKTHTHTTPDHQHDAFIISGLSGTEFHSVDPGANGIQENNNNGGGTTGSSSNLPPYIVCYFWRRTS